MIELEHSPLGGSGAHRFINCAGSFLTQREQIENGEFEDIPSEFANLGTAAHELAATCLTEGTEPYEHISEEFNGFLAGWPGRRWYRRLPRQARCHRASRRGSR